jgi:lactate dehydrogenase-like 2-hydroxyacid dehydrogenase
VGYTPEVLNDCVADMAFALLLAVARRVPEADGFVRSGRWARKEVFPLGRQVSHAKLGIVGLGRIGRTIARRASGFDMEVRYANRSPVDGVPWGYEPDVAELARWCDFLVVMASGGPGTRHLVDARVLQALGPAGYLVNVARGSVVDEQALVRALQERSIAGAGLDVFEEEPFPREELLALDNVVLAPHVSSSTAQTRHAMAARVVANLEAFFAGRPLPSAAPN